MLRDITEPRRKKEREYLEGVFLDRVAEVSSNLFEIPLVPSAVVKLALLLLLLSQVAFWWPVVSMVMMRMMRLIFHLSFSLLALFIFW